MHQLVKLSDHTDKFQNLVCIDVLLTNKCNLRCSYCFQQHTDDHNARYTLESMRRTWDWLRDLNDKKGKKLQFFGGEPMLYKQFILDFLRANKEEFEAQVGHITTSIVSNGLLFDEPFLQEYLSYEGTEINFSIDTIDPVLCERGLNQKQIDIILDAVELACKYGNKSTIAARMNITRENYRGFKDLFYALYERGIRRFWFHPLVHSFDHGMLTWPEESWDEWRNDIFDVIDEGYDFEHFTVIEGVGIKRQEGFSGVTDIAMDGSGDFTSCYVTINQKDEILGNIFEDTLDIETYVRMKTEFDHMIDTDPQCLSCDRKNLCFQFSSANKAMDGVLYRPDNMCQKMVDLYIETNERIAHTKFKRKLDAMIQGYAEEGEVVLARAMVYLIKVYLDRGSILDPTTKVMLKLPEFNDVKAVVEESGVTHRQLLGLFREIILDGTYLPSNIEMIVDEAVDTDANASAKNVYQDLINHIGLQVNEHPLKGIDEDLAYITLLHMVIMSRLQYFHAVAYGGYE